VLELKVGEIGHGSEVGESGRGSEKAGVGQERLRKQTAKQMGMLLTSLSKQHHQVSSSQKTSKSDEKENENEPGFFDLLLNLFGPLTSLLKKSIS
jgi:hypothetical protein